MITNESKVKCPKCGELVSIDDVLTHQIEDKIKKDFEISQKAKEEELTRKFMDLKKEAEKIAESKKDVDSIVAKQIADKLGKERIKLFEEVKAEAEKEQSSKTFFLEEQIKHKDEKLSQALKNELDLRKEKIKLEEDKKSFELEKIRQMEEAKRAIIDEVSKKATEENQYIIAQLKKQLTDATKAKDELARKLDQGSQQTQGEVLELELEELLRGEFFQDEIIPVPKGVKGADVIQKIKDRSGHSCGQIIWESKKTKAWSEGWIQKLKDDQREAKANIAVIVTTVLPANVKGFIFRDGVWICDAKLISALATALRLNLESLAHANLMSVGKNEKMEILYAYLTGVEFKQRVEAIIEAFSSLEDGLKKERRAYEKIWAEREKQNMKVISNTVGMYGDLSGLVTLPRIKALELDDGTDSKEL